MPQLRRASLLAMLGLAATSMLPSTTHSAANAETVVGEPARQHVSIDARAELAGGVGASVTIYVAGEPIGTQMVNSTTFKTYHFPVTAAPRAGESVEIMFTNDLIVNGADRNLIVSSISVNGNNLLATDRAVTYHVGGTYSAAQAVGGQQSSGWLPWNGLLRTTARAAVLVQSSRPKPATLPAAASPDGGLRVVRGPLLLTSGTVLEGVRVSNPDGPCIIVPENTKDVVIRNSEIVGCGSDGDGLGIRVDTGATNITVENNWISDVSSGMHVFKAQHPIRFTSNLVTDVRGPFPRGQMIQFHGVTQGTGQSVIANNVSDKQLATKRTAYEDHINMFMSSGTDQSPILITCNKLRGGDSYSGSGIVLGDEGGGWYKVVRNTLVRTANTGIGIAGAHDTLIDANVVANDGTSVESKTGNSGNMMSYGSRVPRNITLTNNRGVARAWTNGTGGVWTGEYTTNSFFNDRTVIGLTDRNNNWADRSLDGDTVWASTPTGC